MFLSTVPSRGTISNRSLGVACGPYLLPEKTVAALRQTCTRDQHSSLAVLGGCLLVPGLLTYIQPVRLLDLEGGPILWVVGKVFANACNVIFLWACLTLQPSENWCSPGKRAACLTGGRPFAYKEAFPSAKRHLAHKRFQHREHTAGLLYLCSGSRGSRWAWGQRVCKKVAFLCKENKASYG